MIPMTRTKNSIVDKHYEDVVNLVKSLSQPSMCATEVSERAREAFGFLSTPQGPLVILGKNEVDKARRASILEAILRGPKYRFIIDHYRQLITLGLDPEAQFNDWVNDHVRAKIAKDFSVVIYDYSWARMTPIWGPGGLHRSFQGSKGIDWTNAIDIRAPFPTHDDVH